LLFGVRCLGTALAKAPDKSAHSKVGFNLTFTVPTNAHELGEYL